jgi:hypothetical protein
MFTLLVLYFIERDTNLLKIVLAREINSLSIEADT